MIPGTEVLIGEDLIEGHSWAIDAMLLNTDGVGLLNCVCVLYLIRIYQLEVYM